MDSDKTLQEARRCAERFLKFRPRSVREVGEKLADKGFSKETTEKILGELQEQGLLNDEEFARQWAETRLVSKNLGIRRLRSELSQKGISRDIIGRTESYLLEKYDENNNARELLEKKFKGKTADIPEKKMIGVLVRNGYSYSQAAKTVKEIRCGGEKQA